MGRARNADAAKVGHLLQPRRDVDAVAMQVAVFMDYVAQVYADAVLDAPVLGFGCLTLGHFALDRHRAGHRLDHRRELGQQAVAGGFEGPPAVAGKGRINQLRAILFLPGDGLDLVRFHQPGIPDHVRYQNST